MSQWSSKQGLAPEVTYTLMEQDGQPPRSNSSGLKSVTAVVLIFIAVCVGMMTSMYAYSLYTSGSTQTAGQINIMKVDGIYMTMSKDKESEQPLNQQDNARNVKTSSGRTYPFALDVQGPQCTVADTNRFDCWPEYIGATQDKCQQRGCCWQPASTQGAPYCFFPTNYPGYTASNVKVTASGVTADLTRTGSAIFPPDIMRLRLQIDFQTKSRLRVKIFDPANSRFEPPVEVPGGSAAVANPQYKVKVTESPFNIIVTRASTGATVFDTTGQAPFIFADQFIQIGTKLSTRFLYGLGEHRFNFLQETKTWRKLVFWNRDDPPRVDNNGYGSHPFFLNLESEQNRDAHGVLLLNSNAGDVALQPVDNVGGITYRFMGGILDFFVLLGDNPLSVSTQYTNMIGLPYMPPFWSLGFQICKYGITNDAYLQKIINRNRQAQIPYDVQWNDIDYMDQYKDWTYSPSNYGNLPSIVKDLHANKQRYIIMADPAISSSQPAGSYPPFDDGKNLGTFVRNANGDILIGKVWPGETAFPDFFHPNAYQYWYKQAKNFHDKIPFDGLWIDMNEPSSFIDGSKAGCTQSSKYNHPPFTPGTIDGGSLVAKTICPSAMHSLSAHYNLHNMYGWSQANVSRAALNTIYGNKRSPIISRSTFVGSGKFTGHWLGDNFATFEDLGYSIAGILNFNLFGIPLIGADICGFLGDTNEELCTRWHQLGAFYPFMRNHNDIHSKDQDPASFSSPTVDYIRKAIQLRYELLAILYTGFYNAHTKGLPIIRPLFYLYPGSEAVAHQFMWNDQLLVSPVVTKGATTVQAYIPKDTFYDYYTGAQVIGQGTTVTLQAPIDHINVHIRGGSILPVLPVTQRTDDARNQKFKIVVASSRNGTASGELFWDDGESADSISSKKYSVVKFVQFGNTLQTRAAMTGYIPANGILAGEVKVLGLMTSPNNVTVNSKPVNWKYDLLTKSLLISNLSVNLVHSNVITWH